MKPAINLAVYQELVSFLNAVLPTTGKYIVATKKQDEGIKHHILETKDLVAQQQERFLEIIKMLIAGLLLQVISKGGIRTLRLARII